MSLKSVPLLAVTGFALVFGGVDAAGAANL